MNQAGGHGYQQGQPGLLAEGKEGGEEGQNLVVPGVRSVANKLSKSVFSFTASRKALPTSMPPSHQILAECHRHPMHTLSHLQAFAHAVPSARIPFLSFAGIIPSLSH